jgi:hypothetical protein
MSSEPPPWAQPVAAPQPLTRRRVVLLVVTGLLVAASIAAAFTLNAALGGVVASDRVETVTDVEVDIADCSDQFPEWIDTLISSESARIVQVYGTGPVTATSYRHPEGFPTIAVTWAGIIPNCGTTLVIPGDVGVAYYLDATASSRGQFEAMSSILTGLGYVMTSDETDRELLEVTSGDAPAEAPVPGETAAPAGPTADEGAPEATEVSAYRYFRLPDGARIWVRFDPVDEADPDGDGDLYLGYFPAT